MAQSVKVRTSVPSVAEVGERLGISKKQQKSLASIVRRDSSNGAFAVVGATKGSAMRKPVLSERAAGGTAKR